MALFTSFGTSFGPAGICPAEEARRVKDDEGRTASARVAKLPARVQAWRGKVGVDALEMLALIHREYERAGYSPVPLNTRDMAEALGGVSTDDVRRRLASLIEAGAVEETKRLRAPSLYKPEMAPPALLDRPDPVRAISAAVDRINGDLARMKADLFRPSPRGDHTSHHATADLHARIGLRRRD